MGFFLQEETCVTGTNFRTELLTGANGHNKKLYDHKIKLKKLISKIDKLSISNYTILEDSKTSEENMIFSDELKDTSNYLILMGNQFIDRAPTMEIVASNCPNSAQANPVSEDNDLMSPQNSLHVILIWRMTRKKYNLSLFHLKKKKLHLDCHLPHHRMKLKLLSQMKYLYSSIHA